MSISVKSITVSIDGTQSNQFKIEIDGSKFTMSNFTLRQAMLDHSRLSFTLTKDPEEDISETQFKVCTDIIGKPVQLTLQTDPMELEIPNFSGEKVADIEFEGFITNASASRSGTRYSVHVSAVSWDGLLDDERDCQVWEEKYLKDIAESVLGQAEPLQSEVDPEFTTEQYLYCVKWNETSYGFLQRLAIRHGEWLFHDGKTLHFGKMPESEAIELIYPSKDMSSYGINMEARHLNLNHVTSHEYDDKNFTEKLQDKMSDELNSLNEAAYQASIDKFKRPSIENVIGGGYHYELQGSGYIMDLQDRPQAQGLKAGLLTYYGSTYCSKLAIGGKLIVKDNYITDALAGTKSDVQQDEILITSITHSFSNDDTYQNNFGGISANAQFPPYANAAAVPRALSCRAWVIDNNDPERMGRVRVCFGWQYESNQFDRDYIYTPWIRVEQPHAGLDKGFYFIPENGEEVMVDFEGGNAEMPYVRSSLYNPVQKTDDGWASQNTVETNEVKAIRTRNGHTIEIHDAGEGGYIKIYDNKKNNYVLTFSTDSKLISLQSSGDIHLKAANDITLDAGNNIKITAGNDSTVNTGNNMKNMVGNNFHMVVDPSAPGAPSIAEGEGAASDGGDGSQFVFDVGSGFVQLLATNEARQIRENASIQSGNKIEGINGTYAVGTGLGGMTISPETHSVGLWSKQHIALEADTGLGMYANSFVLAGKSNSIITTDGSLDIGGAELHMN